MTTATFLEVGECNIPEDNVKTEETMIQLSQVVVYQNAMVSQCKLEIKRIIYKCGMFWYVKPVK